MKIIDGEAFREWRRHFNIREDATVVLDYLVSTKVRNQLSTDADGPLLQALQPWAKHFKIPQDAVTVLIYLLSSHGPTAVPDRTIRSDGQESGDAQSYNNPHLAQINPDARDNHLLYTSQPSDAAIQTYDTLIIAAGNISNSAPAPVDHFALNDDWSLPDIPGMEGFDQHSDYMPPGTYSYSDNRDYYGISMVAQSDSHLSQDTTVVAPTSRRPGVTAGASQDKAIARSKACIKCWLEKRKASHNVLATEHYSHGLKQCDNDDVGLCGRCASAGISPLQRICVRIRFADEAIFSKWKEPAYMSKLCWESLIWLPVRKDATLKHEEKGPAISVHCCKLDSVSEDQMKIFWKEETGWKSLRTSPYGLTRPPDLNHYIDQYATFYLNTISAEPSFVGQLFRIARECIKEPVIQHSVRLWTATRLLMKGWQLCGHEKLEMTEVTQERSPLCGTIPVPRVLQNQLDHQLEEYIVVCEKLSLRNLQNLIKRRERSEWVTTVVALVLVLNVLERDIWRLLYWIHHPAEANTWRHPSTPCALIDKSIYLSNLMVSHLRSATRDQNPLALDSSNPNGAEALKQLQLELHSIPRKKSHQKYQDTIEESMDFTLSSLPFMESRERFAKLEDFVGDAQIE